MYEKGNGVAQNSAKALNWYHKAADSGYSQAQEVLETEKWTRFSANLGYAESQYRLGMLYLQGKGVVPDYVEAYTWLAMVGVNATGELQQKAIEARQKAAGFITPTDLKSAQAEAKKRLQEIEKKRTAAAQ